MYHIMGQDGREYGPESVQTIRGWLAAQQCNVASPARREGATEWKPLAEWPDFADLNAPAGRRPGDGQALAAIVCGGLGLLICVTAPFGLWLGLAARRRLRAAGVPRNRMGRANAGITLSIVAMALGVLCAPVLAGLLLPALAAARQRANEVVCINNLKELSLAVISYADAHGNRLPAVTNWCGAISNQIAPTVFHCPTQPPEAPCSYAMNARLAGAVMGKINPRTVLLFESEAGWNGAGGAESLTPHARSAPPATRARTQTKTPPYCVSFMDGSVARLRQEELSTLRWEP